MSENGIGRNSPANVAARDARVAELYRKGIHPTIIAKRLGCHSSGVWKRLQKMGLVQPGPTGKHNGPVW